MNQQTIFLRKIAYLAAMIVLLLILYFLGFPAIRNPGSPTQVAPGGKLAQIKDEHELSEVQLGDIDPAGETIRLATFGMRGVAVVYLWEKANDYKMRKDWTNLAATLKQMERVEPHFVSVWRYQGWNLSYNVSAEFDDYRERYRWVIKGIRYLQDGIQYNKKEPMLVWDVGWFIAQKIGRADESKQFRRLFRLDPDFHDPATVGDERDNWLVGKRWFQRACDMVDQGADLKRVTPSLFYSNPPMSQMNFSDNLEKDGTFGEKAQRAFKLAAEEWHAYGERDLPSTEKDAETGKVVTIRMNDVEPLEKQAAIKVKELEALGSADLRQKIREERRQQLSKVEREALDVAPEKRTDRQRDLAFRAEAQLRVDHEQFARRLPAEVRSKALALAREAMGLEAQANRVRSYRSVVNFEYWRRHAEVEQTKDALDARKALYEAEQAISQGDLGKAKERYDKGFALWRAVFDANKGLVEDGQYGRDLMEAINRYKKVLDRRDERFPSPFVLDDVMKLHKGAVSE